MTEQVKGVTINELVDVINNRGAQITPSALTYHCRHGWLKGKAVKLGRDWSINADAADAFAQRYVNSRVVRRLGGD